MPTIRTTMRPGDEIVVSDDEYEQLLDLGLIYDGTPPVEAADAFDVRVAARLADGDSTTRAAIEGLVADAVEGVQDPYVSGLIADDGSATAVALALPTNVRNHGVAGDGTTNDTAALVALIAAPPTSNLHFPEGTYRLTAALTVDTPGLHLTGPGALVQETDDTSVLIVTADDVVVRGLTITGTGTGTEAALPGSYGAGVTFKEVTGGAVLDCTINDCGGTYGAGVWLTSSAGVLVQGNRFAGCRTAVNTDAFYSLASGGHQIIGNRITGGVDGYVLDLQGLLNATSLGDIVSGNAITGCSGKGIILDTAANGATVSDNTIRNCAAEGIAVVQSTVGAIISGNSIHGCQVGLAINRADGSGGSPTRTSIANNRLSGNLGQGVQLYTSYQTSFVGNTISANGAEGVCCFPGYYAQSASFVGNTISANQKEGIVAVDALDWAVIGNAITLNGAAATGTYAALRITQANVPPARNRIIGNSFQFNDAGQSQAIAVHYDGASTSENYCCFNGLGTGYAVSAIVDESGGLVTWGNAGVSNVSVGSTTLGGFMGLSDGVGVVGIAEASTVPTGSPAGGGLLYVQAGALKYRGPGGTVTTLAPS